MARSFWTVVAVVVAVEVFVGVLAVRSVRSDLTCWVSGLTGRAYPAANCGASVALVGRQSWVPAAATLGLCGVTILTGLITLVAQLVKTRHALARLGPIVATPPRLLAIASTLRIEVRLCDDERCFCACRGFLSPNVIISTAMLGLLGDPELTAVLAHEAAHVRHRDPARALAVRCAANALFYVPVARHLSRQALVACELGADANAAAVAGHPALITALLDILGRARPALGTVTEMASLDSLDSRIEALRTRLLPRSRPRLVTLSASAFALVGLALLGAWFPQPIHQLIERPVIPAHQITPVTQGTP